MPGSCHSRATSINQVIFDTSILVDLLRYGKHQERVEAITGLLRTSSVVLAELWRGATKPLEMAFLRSLEKDHPVLVPTKQNWLDSGQLLGQIRQDQNLTAEKLRNLHFDVLIALTARSNGARLITSDRADFELIAKYKAARMLNLEIW